MNVSSMPHRDPAARPANVGTAVKLMYVALGMDIYSFLHYRSRILEITAEAGLRHWISFGIALVMLFRNDSSAWFNTMKRAGADSPEHR